MIINYEPKHLDEISARDGMYPTYSTWYNKEEKGQGIDYGTTFGYTVNGSCKIFANDQTWLLKERNYFAIHGQFDISELDGEVWTVTKLGYNCMPTMGQVEHNGRLSYIDGCSDSVLVSMPRYGDPVLNYLHFPTGIYQTQHTHPSVRMGIVISGEGEAFQEKDNWTDGWTQPLKKGCMFMLEESELHSFRTTNEHMDIIAYHPDSDTGPTDEDHSMINRTYIDHGKK